MTIPKITLGNLSGWKRACVACVLCGAAIASQGQTFKTVFNFGDNTGNLPSGLVQGIDGDLYGTTYAGVGLNGVGTVFKATTDGVLTTLHSFNGFDGAGPDAALILATDGNFYATTAKGGTGSSGTVFKITPQGSLTILHSFDSTDGALPVAGLVEGAAHDLYGTTSLGGSTYCLSGCGTVFKIDSAGTLTTLHRFNSPQDGGSPEAALFRGPDGSFLGTTSFGGVGGHGLCPAGCGTLFRITSEGAFATLHTFNWADGSDPVSALVQGTDGNLYGATSEGGAQNTFCVSGCGTLFKSTGRGIVTTLHIFDHTDGAYPDVALIEGTDGNFYGTTEQGGANGYGTIFSITPEGVVTSLHSFDYTNGFSPGGLIQATNGIFYGVTEYGGANGEGTIFSLDVGLGQFVENLPTFGKVGATVRILGTNLTGATSVTFNGTPASFTVVSPTLIKTTVPTGATTGSVQVVTPTGTLTSNTVFRVK